MPPRLFRYCPACGQPVTQRVPDGDSRLRDCCDHCGIIHYANPRPVVGTIPVWNDQVLLCRRAIEPRLGYWTLPAGFMEIGETTADGAIRETLEEAHARVAVDALYTMVDVPQAEQVHIFFRARLLDLDFSAGPESLEVRLFGEAEIPWPDLAFRTVTLTLQLYFDDRRRGRFGTHARAIEPGAARPDR